MNGNMSKIYVRLWVMLLLGWWVQLGMQVQHNCHLTAKLVVPLAGSPDHVSPPLQLWRPGGFPIPEHCINDRKRGIGLDYHCLLWRTCGASVWEQPNLGQ
jgi:hypothetical protein